MTILRRNSLPNSEPAKFSTTAKPDLVQHYNELLRLRERVHALATQADSYEVRSLVPQEH
jgi:hypothetical protein